MSAKNPLTILKSTIFAARTRAYHVLRITDMAATVDYIASEVDVMISPTLIREAIKAWIRDMITSKIEQTESAQLDLWKGDFYFPIKRFVDKWALDYTDVDGQKQTEFFDSNTQAQVRASAVADLNATNVKVLLRKIKQTKEIALVDLELDDLAQIEERKEQNIQSAIKERDRFRRYADIVRPILIDHPGWTWGQAVAWLESRGPLPDLD